MKSARLLLFLAAFAFAAPAYAHSRHHHDVSRPSAAHADKNADTAVSGDAPHIDSRYAVLMDANSGKVLFSEHPYTHREPASLTKMAAAIVLIENGRLTDTVVAPAGIEKTPESSLHLTPGEKISLHDLLYAMLLRSANDTPIAGAHYLCGSVAPFVGLMNQKVAQIGCQNTHFVTPNGLYDPHHYSCAYDLALIARYAILNLPTFNEIVKTQRYRVHRSVHIGDSLVVNTASKFLKTFPGADGIKTGYISQSGHCFVGSSTHNGWRLIAVALNSNKCREDVEQMLSYGFANYRPMLVLRKGMPIGVVPVSGGISNATVVASHDLYDAIPKNMPAPSLSAYSTHISRPPISAVAPIHPGEKLGSVTIVLAGKPVASADAIAEASVAMRPPVAHALGWTRNLGRLGTILLAAIGGFILLIGAAFLGLMLYGRAITKNSRRRRSRLAQALRTVDQ